MDPVSSEERARLIATAEMVLHGLKEVRSRQPATADIQVMERWITRVAGVGANLDAVTEWEAAEAYRVNSLHPGEALRRLFPNGLDDRHSFETELERLEREIDRDERERVREPPPSPMTRDDSLEDLLWGHASARFRYLDVRSIGAWRRERLRHAINIPLESLPKDGMNTFTTGTHLVVFGDDGSATEDAVQELKAAGFEHVIAIPRGFAWFKERGWETDVGPNRG
jgi:rhodanese-related sulfurtransferase